MPGGQPDDGWTFLQPEDFGDDADLERIQRDATRDPETAAIHVHRSDRPLRDPGVADVATGAPDDRPPGAVYFSDEEPDVGDGARSTQDPEVEPELQEILESQHYTFEDDDDDG